MTLRELDIFFELCKEPHLSNLAKRVSISQSAISLSIKSLEKKLGEELFDRVGKRLVLNERGRAFYELVSSHYIGLKESKELFLKEKIVGCLRIASSKTIGNFVVPPEIFKFLEDFENVEIKQEITNSANIIHKILNGEIDLGFIESYCDNQDIIKRKFGSDELIVVTKDKELSRKSYFIDELFYKKWLFRESGSGTKDIFLNQLGDIAKNLEPFMLYSEFDELKSILLSNKKTITCISNYVVQKEIDRKELFRVKIKNFEFKRDFFIIFNRKKHISELLNRFIERFV